MTIIKLQQAISGLWSSQQMQIVRQVAQETLPNRHKDPRVRALRVHRLAKLDQLHETDGPRRVGLWSLDHCLTLQMDRMQLVTLPLVKDMNHSPGPRQNSKKATKLSQLQLKQQRHQTRKKVTQHLYTM